MSELGRGRAYNSSATNESIQTLHSNLALKRYCKCTSSFMNLLGLNLNEPCCWPSTMHYMSSICCLELYFKVILSNWSMKPLQSNPEIIHNYILWNVFSTVILQQFETLYGTTKDSVTRVTVHSHKLLDETQPESSSLSWKLRCVNRCPSFVNNFIVLSWLI